MEPHRDFVPNKLRKPKRHFPFPTLVEMKKIQQLMFHLLKWFFLFIPLFLFSLDLFSQGAFNFDTIKHRKFVQAFEIVAGPTFLYTQPKFENNAQKLKIEYAVKVTLIHSLSKTFELCTSLLFERKGIKSTAISSIETVRITGDRTNDYLTLSLIPRYMIGKQPRFNIGIGGYISLLKSSKTAYVYDSSGVRRQYYGAAEPHYRKYDFGISLEVGYIIPLNQNKLITIQILNSNGLIDIDRYDRYSSSSPSLVSMSRNNSLSLLVGVRFKR